MARSPKIIMGEIKTMIDEIAKADNEIDYVAILDFALETPGADVVKTHSHYTNPKRPVDSKRVIQIISLERENFQLVPYNNDKMVDGTDTILRFCPTGVNNYVIMFLCYEHGEIDTFRAAAHKWREKIIERLQEFENSV